MDIAIDIGGTFTDLVLRREGGDVRAYKAPTTPGRLIDGVFDGLDLIARDLGLERRALLRGLRRFAFGTTAATNAILEGKTARIGLLATRGFRETLLAREGGKSDTYNLAMDYPPPFVPRALTLEVDERVNAEGGVERPLDEASVAAAVERLRGEQVEAIAVSLLWSIANPAHEARVGEIIAEQWPEIPVSLGHRVNPCLREYRRTSAVAMDAALKPVVARAIGEMGERLAEGGFGGVLTYVTSSGDQTSAEDLSVRPVSLCFSGPSAAPAAARRFARLEGETGGDVIAIDMGGTSFDVSIISGWRIPLHREGEIAGHHFGVPSIEIHTVGAGGGSIARVDAGGMLHTGPESAGSRPGPACYRRGGERATVTDANVALGFLDPESFADGRMTLDADAARRVIDADVAQPLGLDVEAGASLVALSCEQAMVGAIADLTVKRGVDPRDYMIVAGGAAAGLHAVAIARELGVRRVLAPRFAGVMSAFGILTGDVGCTFGRACFTSSDRFDFEAVNATLAELEARGAAYLHRMGFDDPAGRRLEFSVEARYAGQVWQLSLPLSAPRIESAEALAGVVEDFHRLHESRYFVRSVDDAVECTEWSLRASGRLPDADLPSIAAVESPVAPRCRRAWFRELGAAVDTPVFAVTGLPVGWRVEGPAIIEEPLTTFVLPPGSAAHVTRYGALMIELADKENATP